MEGKKVHYEDQGTGESWDSKSMDNKITQWMEEDTLMVMTPLQS